MIKAIFFDVDGTLLSHKTKQIPEGAKKVLEQLKEQGIKIFMSTGRHTTELAELPVNDVAFDGYITLNGQLCLDENRKMLFGMPFAKEITKVLGNIFEEKKCPLAFIEESRIYLNFVNDTVRKAQESISTPVPEIGIYEQGDLYQVTAFFKEQEEEVLRKQLPKGCRLARWSEHGVDIILDEGGKVAGIKYFCEKFGIDRSEIMAFGDAENDIDMLQFAGIGVAIGNARDEVKKVADYVTADVDDGGIKKAIGHFICQDGICEK